MQDHPEEKIRTNKGLIRVYFTLFSIGLSTIILSIIFSEHKESVALFKNYNMETLETKRPTFDNQNSKNFKILKQY
jgi:hypothetical protein